MPQDNDPTPRYFTPGQRTKWTQLTIGFCDYILGRAVPDVSQPPADLIARIPTTLNLSQQHAVRRMFSYPISIVQVRYYLLLDLMFCQS